MRYLFACIAILGLWVVGAIAYFTLTPFRQYGRIESVLTWALSRCDALDAWAMKGRA